MIFFHKTVSSCTDIFRGQRKGTLGTNVLKDFLYLKLLSIVLRRYIKSTFKADLFFHLIFCKTVNYLLCKTKLQPKSQKKYVMESFPTMVDGILTVNYSCKALCFRCLLVSWLRLQVSSVLALLWLLFLGRDYRHITLLVKDNFYHLQQQKRLKNII